MTATRIALCWGSAPEADLHQLIEAAAAHGFDEITVTAGHYLAARAGGAEDVDLRDALKAHGVAVSVIDPLIAPLPGTPHPAEVRADWRHFFEYTTEDCFAAAGALGARTVNLAHFLGSPVKLEDLAAVVRDIAAEAALRGLSVSLEFIPETGVPTLEAALEVLARSGAANAGVMFDTWHFLRSGAPLTELDALRPGQVLELQLSDRRRPPPGEAYTPMAGRLPPGEGEAPLARIVMALRGVSPDLVLGVEVFTTDGGSPDSIAARLGASTRTFLERTQCC